MAAGLMDHVWSPGGAIGAIELPLSETDGDLLDYSTCNCGFRAPLRRSKHVIPGEDQKCKETGDETLQVACKKCKRVFITVHNAKAFLAVKETR